MPWTNNEYPASMKNLPTEVREKAIEIANALLESEETNMDEGIAIATAISRAKDWAANRGIDIESTAEDSKSTDVKQHGEDRYVIPYEGSRWAVKSEGSESVEKIFDYKVEAVKYARKRKPFGKALAENQAIQWPLVELQTQCEMLRLLIRKTAWQMDRMEHKEIEKTISDKVSMCNYWANRLVCEAADRAMQVHGGIGYSRHKPFEHIFRHHRRYRITEGAEEIQMRRVAGYLFGYLNQQAPTGVQSITGR